MKLVDLRKELGYSQDEMAKALGLTSKGYVSDLERGESVCSVKVALAYERLSEGRISAADLHPDVSLVRQSDHGAAA